MVVESKQIIHIKKKMGGGGGTRGEERKKKEKFPVLWIKNGLCKSLKEKKKKAIK